MSYNVAVVGATGNVGREMLNILDEHDLQGPSRRLQPARLLDGQVREDRPTGVLLLRRDRPDGHPRGRLEDAHRLHGERNLVRREDLPQRAASVQPADGPAGTHGPCLGRV